MTVAPDEPIEQHLEAGRDALRRHDWEEAYEHLSAAQAAGVCGPLDLEGLAKSAWWTGRRDRSIEAWERAYAGHVARDDKQRAALCALALRRLHTEAFNSSMANGWLRRAERLVEGEPQGSAHGHLILAHVSGAWARGDLDEAIDGTDRAAAIGRRFDDRDLEARAGMYKGMLLIDRGSVPEGLALVEEVCVAAAAGELSPYLTCSAFCNGISTRRNLAEYKEARELCEVADGWYARQTDVGPRGDCRVHRAEIMRLFGDWTKAEEEVSRACDDLVGHSPVHAGEAFHELGELRLRTGDFDGADEAFRRAREYGCEPQPGQALLLLAEGKRETAAASIRRTLDEESWDALTRARLLPAQAEIARATDDRATIRSAWNELEQTAQRFGTIAVRADAARVQGMLLLAEGDATAAVGSLRTASRLWKEMDLPYEAATTGLVLAEAYAAEGDPEAAMRELDASKAIFDRLGAAPASRRAGDQIAQVGSTGATVTRADRTFIFTDIVGSTALLEAIGDDAWEELRAWHEQALRSCFVHHGGVEVDHAGDGFFVAFEDVGLAVECAVEIQRLLARHRREHGFAPQIRIGVHAAQATRTGSGYSGKGVHVAARIGALAGGGEIVATAETIRDLRGFSFSEPRPVSVKGISQAVDVVSVTWR